jgi:ribosomal protein S18 acetylase RimI-like enzyme
MIRKFKTDDLDTIMDIGNRAWQNIIKHSRKELGDDIYDCITTASDATRKGLQVKNTCTSTPECVFVCEEDGKIVGFITFMLNSKLGVAEIGNNAVDPECGLKGIGQQMYSEVLKHFRELDMKVIKVSTGLDDAHAPARRAYERAGFDKSLETITYYMDLA